MSRLRRFIAGARCPRCEALDTLVLEEREGTRCCRCVTCGFSDSLDRAAGGVEDPRNRGLGTRETEAVPVQIVQPPSDRR